MAKTPSASAAMFRRLCRVLGGQDRRALTDCIAAGLLPQLCRLAQRHDQLPALAVRCSEQHIDSAVLGEDNGGLLKQALLDNTRRNLQISAQAIKIAVRLNHAGIIPLFLKGTARLLVADGGNLGFRQQSDIDVIVKPAEITAAGDVFLADGYRYCLFSGNLAKAPRQLGDTAEALKLSGAHHHLLPLAKHGYAATVELHRHFLDKRFQRANPLESLFASAQQFERHGATFQVPSTEYQIIHLVLGKLVNDGHLARRTFPLREACDLIDLLQDMEETKVTADNSSALALIDQQCGRPFSLFVALVTELMAYAPQFTPPTAADIAPYLWMMQKRCSSPKAAALLDAYARADYLAHTLLYSPAKLPAYLGRMLSAVNQGAAE